MGTRIFVFAVMGLALAGCTRPVDIEKERAALLATDSEWMRAANDADKFASFYSPTASFYAPGMPVIKGQEAIREVFKQVASAPGFNLTWNTTSSEVAASGDIAYLAGTYELKQDGGGEKGKSITVWKKQADGAWKVVEDIFNPNESPPPPAPPAPVAGHHTHVAPPQVTWGDAPPNLPRGAKLAVVSGDPSKPEPFVLRLQLPAGYTVAPHWHPTDEHVTVLAGTLSLGMGETLDKSALQDLPAGGYALLPAEMRHYAVAKTAATIQVHGMGPFAINYVNPADDPSVAKKN
jgi:uncharacterized protein (TIGR02246 family)